MKNDIFNFRRFGKYFASDFRACSANFGLSALLISLAGVIVYAVDVITGLIFEQVWDAPGLGERFAIFAVAMTIFIVTMPAKTYGFVTEKRAGSSWLMLPVSRLEKVLSMLALTVVVLPILSAAAYLATDAIICSLDSTCGQSLAAAAINLKETIAALMENEVKIDGVTIMGSGNAAYDFIHQITCPWLYVDDIIGFILAFLLGALVFKSGKAAKTILAFILFSICVSMILSTVLGPWSKELMEIANSSEPSRIFDIWIFRHAALTDTINDTVFNLALLAGIWFRIKTLKH